MSILPKVETGPYTTQDGPHYTIGKSMEVWAQDGLIWVLDFKDGSYRPYTVSRIEKTVQALIREYKSLKSSEENWKTYEEKMKDRTLMEFYREAIEAFNNAIQDAIRQGDQSDENIRKEKLSEFLLRKNAGTNPAIGTQKILQEIFDEENKKDIMVFDKETGVWKSVDKYGRDKDTGKKVEVLDNSNMMND